MFSFIIFYFVIKIYSVGKPGSGSGSDDAEDSDRRWPQVDELRSGSGGSSNPPFYFIFVPFQINFGYIQF